MDEGGGGNVTDAMSENVDWSQTDVLEDASTDDDDDHLNSVCSELWPVFQEGEGVGAWAKNSSNINLNKLKQVAFVKIKFLWIPDLDKNKWQISKLCCLCVLNVKPNFLTHLSSYS